MKVSAATPTKSIVDHVLYGGFVVSQDYGPHLMHWTMACRSAMSAFGMTTPLHSVASTLRQEQADARRVRDVLRRICVDPHAWIGKFEEGMVRWINVNMDPPDGSRNTGSVPFHNARQRALSFPELLAYENSLAVHRKGVRPLAHLAPIFPYHQVYCPSSADGKLYVSLFKWLSTTVRREKCWTVLDWNAQSGIISRSLMTHGVRNLFCLDFTARGLKTAQESIQKEIGPAQYAKIEGTGSIQYVPFSPDRGAGASGLIASSLPPALHGMKFDIIVTHVPMPIAAVTPHTDLTMHNERLEASKVDYVHQFLDLCESTLLRCAGRYVAIITHNYHSMVAGEPLLHPLPEPTNWELIHRDKCSLRESPELFGACGEQIKQSEESAFFLSTSSRGNPEEPLWMETYLRDAAAYLWIFRLKGARKPAAKPVEEKPPSGELMQHVPWKESFDYHTYQPKDGPLLASQISEIPTFSFLQEAVKVETASVPSSEKERKPSLPFSQQKSTAALQPKSEISRGHRRKPSDKEIARKQLASLKDQIQFLKDLSKL